LSDDLKWRLLEGRERENASSNNNQQLTTKTIQAILLYPRLLK
jgi:hypothetical protein